MSNERQINYVNNLQNRAQNLYYVDDANELNSINLKENDKIYVINDNKLFQMEIADQEEELSGAIVSFNGRNNTKVEELTVNVEPIQDLHGYENPWPAGGGKNKLQNLQTTQTISGVTFTVYDDGSVNVNGTATELIVFTLNDVLGNYLDDNTNYILSGSPLNSDTSKWKFRVYNVGDNIDVGSGIVFTFRRRQENQKCDIVVYSGTTMSNVLIKPMIRLSSVTDNTFAPYSNICPISGRTSATVTRTGKNLLKLSDWETESDSGITIGTDNISIINKGYQETLNRYNVLNRSACVFSFHVKTIAMNDSRASFAVYADGTTKLTGIGTTVTGNITLDSVGTEKDITITVPNGKEYISFGGWAWGGEVQISNLQLELGSTATTYEPYQGNTYTIQLGDTVYGGTLDVTSGVLTVDMAMVDLGTWNWMKGNANNDGTGYIFRHGISGMPLNTNAISSHFKRVVTPSAWEALHLNEFYIPAAHVCVCADYPDASAFKTAVSGVQFVYELATPIEITLTPTQIDMLLGENNLWADAGDINIKIAEKGITAFELEPHI